MKKKLILVIVFLSLILLPCVQSDNDKGIAENIKIIINPENPKYGDEITITIKIPKNLWQEKGLVKIRVILKQDNITLFQNDYKEDKLRKVNEHLQLNVYYEDLRQLGTSLLPGRYQVNIQLRDKANKVVERISKEFTISRLRTFIKVYIDSTEIREEIKLTIYERKNVTIEILDEKGMPLSNRTARISYNSSLLKIENKIIRETEGRQGVYKVLKIMTDKEGQITLRLKGKKKGEAILSLSFEGDEIYEGSEIALKIIIEFRPAKIVMLPDKNTFSSNESVYFLVYDGKNYTLLRDVKIIINGRQYDISLPYLRININEILPANLQKMTLNLNITLDDDRYNASLRRSVTVYKKEKVVKKIKTKLIPVINFAGNTWIIEVKLLDLKDNPIKKEEIILKVNRLNEYTRYTDESGTAVFDEIKVSKEGEVLIQLEFRGSKKYDEAYVEFKLSASTLTETQRTIDLSKILSRRENLIMIIGVVSIVVIGVIAKILISKTSSEYMVLDIFE